MTVDFNKATVAFWPDWVVAEFSAGDEVYDIRNKYEYGVVIRYVAATTKHANYLIVSWYGVGTQKYDHENIDDLRKVKRRIRKQK